MQLITSPTRDRFELLDCTEEEGKGIIKGGWRLDGKKFCYYTRSPELVSQYNHIAEDPSIRNTIIRHQMAVMFSKATDCKGLDFSKPPGLEYMPFQKVGISYALNRPRTLIADEPGLGKTIQAVGVMNAKPDIKSVLVVCPAILKTNWVREINKWYLRLDGIDIAYTPAQAAFPQTNIVVVNYDILMKLRIPLTEKVWDLVIYDESQALKDAAAQRSKAVFGWTDKKITYQGIKAKTTLFLSGTPLVNRPEDLWTMIKYCDPDDLGATWDYYGHRYCQMWKAPWGWDSSGAAHLPELQNRLRGKFMIRRLKKDVLQDLPAKRRQIVVIQPKDGIEALLRKELEAYERARGKLELTIEAAQAAIKSAQQVGDWEGYKKKAEDLSGYKGPEFAELSRLRHEVAVAKVPYAVEYLRLMLEEHDKVVVFAHHIDVITALLEAFTAKVGTVSIYGDTEEKKRWDAIDKFQTDPKCKLIIVSLSVCLGFTLTASSYCLAVELDWRPSVMQQCEDRLHRIGQKDAVIIQHLIFAKSTDVLQVKKVIEKQDVIDQALG